MRVITGVWVLVWLGIAGCSGRGGSEASVAQSRSAAASELSVGPEIGTEAPTLVQKDLGWNPSVASDGTGFLAAQTIADRIRAVRVDASGRVLDPYWLSLGGQFQQIYPDIAYGAGHYLVTWTEPDRAEDPDNPDDRAPDSVRGRFVKPDGTVEGNASFVISSGDSLYSSAAWTGSHFIVAWLGFETSGANVHTVLLDASGARVPNSEHVVSTSGHVSDPQLAVSANQAFVTWYDYSSSDSGSTSVIYGARVATDGSVLDPGGQPLSGDDGYASSIAVASDGSSFLTVWQTSGSPSVVRGSLVKADGSVLVRDVALADPSIGSGLPAVAYDGAQYLVAWATDREDRSVYGVHVSTSGVVSGEERRLSAGSTRSGVFGSDRTVLAASESQLLLAFLGTGVQGTLLSPNLDIQVDSIGLTALPNAQGYPQATWNGANYLVTTMTEFSDPSAMTLRGVRIDGQGMVLDPNGLKLSGEAPAFSSSLASNGRGSALVSWTDSGDPGSQALRSVASSGALGDARAFPPTETYSSLALAANGQTYFAVIENVATSKVDGYLLDATGATGEKIEIADTNPGSGAQVFAAGDGFLVRYYDTATKLVPVSASGVVGAPLTLSDKPVFVQVATDGDHSLLVWSGNDTHAVYGQRFAAGALVGQPFVITEQSSGFGAAATWDGESYFTAWDREDYTIEGRFIGADGTLGDVMALAGAEASGPVLSSDGHGQMLLSYVRWLEHAQTRRVTSRLLGRGAGEEGGAGGSAGDGGGGAMAGGGAAQSSGGATMSGGNQSAGGSSGSAGQSSGAGGTATGGAMTGGATTGGSSSGSGGSAGANMAGGAGVPQLPPGCALSAAPSTGSASLWIAAALSALMLRRRQQRIP